MEDDRIKLKEQVRKLAKQLGNKANVEILLDDDNNKRPLSDKMTEIDNKLKVNVLKRFIG